MIGRNHACNICGSNYRWRATAERCCENMNSKTMEKVRRSLRRKREARGEKLNKKTRESIREKHPMWWEYRHADWSVRTDLAGYRLLAMTERFESGSTRNRVNFKTASYDKALAVTEALKAEGVDIAEPTEFID